MRKIFLSCFFALLVLFSTAQSSNSQQRPCSANPEYRQFDFWIGEWEVYGLNGKVAGHSKISLVLDSCIILEEWTGASGFIGKSFNKWNADSKQWQQTWVDNMGGSTEFLRGEGATGKITLYADRNKDNDGKNFLRKLTFTKLSNDKVRQHGERSNDGGTTWTTEYDLEYRKKK